MTLPNFYLEKDSGGHTQMAGYAVGDWPLSLGQKAGSICLGEPEPFGESGLFTRNN